MIDRALENLNAGQFVLRGEPTTESEFNQMFRKVTGSTDDGAAILSDNPADFGVTWAQVQSEVASLAADKPLEDLRTERNAKLAETDWWAVKDRTMSQAEKDYRQALRDITDTYSSLETVVWPTKPES